MNLGRRLATLGRAPLPEWQELAHTTAGPGRVARWFADHFLPCLALPYLVLLVGVFAGSPILALAGWLLGAVLDWAATRADSRLSRIAETAGATPSLRAAIRSLLVVWVIGPPAAAGYVAVVVVIQAAWLGLTGLAAGFSRSAPPLRYLPGSKVQRAPLTGYTRFYRRAVGTPLGFVLAEASALAGAVLLALGWGVQGAILLAVALLIALGYAAVAGSDFLRLLRRADADAAALVAELAAAQPRYLVHVSLGAGQSRYIANQWLPVLDATPTPGLIAVREASQLAPLRQTRVPVVYAPSPRNLEQVTLPSVRVGLYLAYGEKNAHLLRDARLRHVMLSHGDSDKATSANAMARTFDQVWVAGQAGVDRFKAAGIRLRPEQVVMIGRPQIEPLLRAQQTGSQPPVVLYAPTFEGYYEETEHSSLDTMGPAIVRGLLSHDPRVQVWFKPHPASGVVRPSMLAAISEIEELLADSDHVLVDRTDLSLTDCLARADVLVSDISSVISDFFATGRPVLVTDPAGLGAEEFRARYPSQRASYLIPPDLADFDATLAAALGPDPLRAERTALTGYLLGEHPDGPQAAFDAALVRLCSVRDDPGQPG